MSNNVPPRPDLRHVTATVRVYGVCAVLRAVLCMSHRAAAVQINRPAGVLLHGPPGCGKTELVHALARVCGVPLLAVKVRAHHPSHPRSRLALL